MISTDLNIKELEEVAGEREVWASVISLLEDGWMDGGREIPTPK